MWKGLLRRRGLPASQELQTDVGPLLLPAGDEVMRPLIARTGDWELDEALLFRAHIAPGATVVDVGAHVGYYTVLAARAVGPRGQVIAVEPHPENAALLRANLACNGLRNVRVLEAAAWREPGRLLLEPSREQNTADHRVALTKASSSALKVDAVQLDDALARTDVDVVKVDAQGADHVALQGMEQMLRRCRPVVFCEFWPHGIRELGEDPAGAISFYRSLSFRLTMPGVQASFDDWPAAAFVDAAESLPGSFGTLVLRPRG